MVLDAGHIIVDRYQIVEKIGVGGMAIVYMAKDLKLDRYVTFKVLKEEHLSDDFVFSKFSTEAKAAARLSNQNVVSVYDVGVENNIHYIVMEYIDGITLKELINMRAPFHNEEAIGVAIQIAQALSHAHANKIVHQDIKPQNILITTDGIVKVTDFGIASAQVSSATTTASTPVGSVHYFSPEQARGRFVDHRSDIYSLGIVLYEMITGQVPFDGESPVAIAIKHINEPIPPIPMTVSQSLESIILKATKKLSNQRYATIENMLEDLKLAITDETPLTPREALHSENTIILNEAEQAELNERLSEVTLPHSDYSNDLDYSDDSDYSSSIQSAMPSSPPAPMEKPAFDIFNPHPTDPESVNKHIEKKVMYIGIGTAAVLSLIILIIFMLEISSNGGNNVSTLPANGENGVLTAEMMPNLEGLDWETAVTLLGSYGLVADRVSTYDETIPEGIIIGQMPDPGTALDEPVDILLAVSQGPFLFQVPDFVGETVADIQAMFHHISGITLNLTHINSDEPVTTIISQTPQPGTVLGYGSTIGLLFSQGPETVNATVPNMVGITEEAAVAMLEQVNLLPNISRINHETIPAGNVISQANVAASSLPAGSWVGLTVSLGPVEPTIGDGQAEEEPVQDQINQITELEPEPEPEPEPELELEPVPQITTLIVPFHLPGDFDSALHPQVDVIVLVDGVNVFDNTLPADGFPVSIPIHREVGTGNVLVQFFISNILVGYDILTF